MRRMIRKMALAALAAPLAAAGFEMRVGPGDDLVRARDEIRAARSAGRIPYSEPVTVTLAPGTYLSKRTVLLEDRDSGRETAPVTWRAERRGTVRILGGSAIPRTAFRPVADVGTRDRLDASVRDAVRVADVSDAVVGELKPWTDHPDGSIPGPWLYHAGKAQTLARWPNADAPDGGWHGFTKTLENGGFGADKKANAPAAFEFPGDRAARWRIDAGVWLTGYVTVDWHCDTIRIASYDPATHAAKFAAVSHYGVGGLKGYPPRRRFFVQNLLEELDQPGEWYLDRAAKRLYWYPLPEAADDEIVLAQNLTPAFRLVNAAFVRIENIDFAYTHGGTVVRIEGGRRCLVKDCGFFNHGGTPVAVDGTRHRVTGCEMRNLGGGAVSVSGGSVKALLPANNLVDRCTIDTFGQFQRTHGCGVTVSGCGNAVRHNRFFNSPDCALTYSGNEHLIADNEFGRVVQFSLDAGCIYTGHRAHWLGTILFGNYFHDFARTPDEAANRSAIYFDDCDWGDDVIGNTFVNAGMAVLIGGGKLHGVYNNLMKDCRNGVHCDGRGRRWRATGNGSFYWNPKGVAFCRYRHAEDGIDYDFAPWSVVYPALREAMDDHPEYPGMNTVTGNVFQTCARVFGYDADAQVVMGAGSPGNRIVTNAAERLTAPQPIRLDDAADNRLASPDGKTVARFLLDESGHFAWTLRRDGRPVLDRSPLGISVGHWDYGRKVVPAAAEDRGETSLAAFTNGTVLTSIRGGVGYKNVSTNTAQVAALTAREWRIPLRSLVTAETVACLDVRVWDGGAAYRWTVPGTGVRRVQGENDAFMPAGGDRSRIALVEWERDGSFANGYPESFYYARGSGCGVSFPEAARGWNHEGDVVSPWRGVLSR